MDEFQSMVEETKALVQKEIKIKTMALTLFWRSSYI